MKSKFSLKMLEKLSYIVGVPTLLAYSGYSIYHRAS